MSSFKTGLWLLLFFFSCDWAQAGASDSLRVDYPEQNPQIASTDTDPWFGVDKGLHLVSSMMVTIAVSQSMERLGGISRRTSVYYGFGISLTLGSGKEFWDSQRPHNFFSLKDLTADFLGSALGVYLARQK